MRQQKNMATKQAKIVPQYVEFIPESLSDGTLYISRTYKTAVHKCCCGCGEEVVTPLMSTEWTLSTNKDGVSLYPSIGNWSMPCRSHYWIRNSKVIWAGAMSKKVTLCPIQMPATKAMSETLSREGIALNENIK